MGVAHARGPEQQQRLAVADPARARQLPDLLGVERELGIEVDPSRVCRNGNLAMELDLDALLVLPRGLGLAQEGGEALAQRGVRPGRLVEQPVQAVADCGELQARQHALQGFDVRFGVHSR